MLVPLSEVFASKYGHQLNANALEDDEGGVNVTRSRKRLGINRTVKRLPLVEPSPPGLITVSLGGTYLLSSFVQPAPFYTAQNVKVLSPREEMTFPEKVYYCLCITHNRRRYSSHGREANRSLDSLLVPDRGSIPAWAQNGVCGSVPVEAEDLFGPAQNEGMGEQETVSLKSLFDLYNGVNAPAHIRADQLDSEHHVPFVRPSKDQFGSFSEYVDRRFVDPRHVYPSGSLYISTNGQGSHTYAYVATCEFIPNSDVTVAIPKRAMSVAEKLFYAMAITQNRRLFSYGRKPKGERLALLALPASPPPYVYDQSEFPVIDDALC